MRIDSLPTWPLGIPRFTSAGKRFKFVESVGGKLEFWFFDFGTTTAYSVIDYPDEIAAATAQLSTNSAGFAHVTIRPLLSAEEMDEAVAKLPPVHVPQEQ